MWTVSRRRRIASSRRPLVDAEDLNQILPNQSQLYDAYTIVFPTNERLMKTASGAQRSSFFWRVFRRSAVCSGGPWYVANAKDPNLTAKSASDYLRADIRWKEPITKVERNDVAGIVRLVLV